MSVIAPENAKTLENLLAAFQGESNAAARYTAFAIKADADGWRGAASLFRAAARAEQIHAINHARVIKQLGGEAKCILHEVEVQSTLENLHAALAGESYEVDTMYLDFLVDARERNLTAAVRSMEYALEAEKTHARLYGEAIALIESEKKDSWISNTREFYVCPVCGYTSEDPEEHDRCPVCNALWEKFEVVR